MGTKTIRLDESVYERLAARKREDETFSEAVERLTSEYTLLDFAGGYSENAAREHRAMLAESSEVARRQHRDLLDRLDNEE